MREIAFCTKWGSAALATASACHCHCTHAGRLRSWACASAQLRASVYACIQVHLYLLCAGKVGQVGKTWPLRCWFASSWKLCCKHATRTAHPAQARCTMQGPRKLAPTSCETNLDDGVEVPNGAHSDQSQGPFCGVCRSERRMEACHRRRANCHWRTLPPASSSKTCSRLIDP